MAGTDPGRVPGTRAAARRAGKARAARNAQIKVGAMVVGGLLAIAAVWAVVVAPGLALVTGDPSGGTPTSGSASRDPTLADLDGRSGSAQGGAPGFTQSATTVGLDESGFAPICGGPAESDGLVLVAVTSTMTGSVGAGAVSIRRSQAVYRSGGVSALLAEAARAACVDRGDPLPRYPRGSVLLRGRGSTSVAYLVTATSSTTALYLKVSSSAEGAVAQALVTVVPGLVSQAQAGAGELTATVRRSSSGEPWRYRPAAGGPDQTTATCSGSANRWDRDCHAVATRAAIAS